MKSIGKLPIPAGAFLLLAVLILPAREAERSGPVSLEYYGEIGCSHCDTFAETTLPAAAVRAGVAVELVQVDILSARGYELCRARLAEFDQEFRIFPVLVIGNNAYQGSSAIEVNLDAELGYFSREGIYRPRVSVAAPSGTLPGVRLEFIPIVLAGLVDGINPCAFTTLLFFLSFISLRGGSRGRIAGIGLLFAAGVFLSYLLVGLGLFNVFRSGMRMTGFRLVLRILVTALTAGFCALTIRDLRLLRLGKPSDMRWGLPDAVRRGIHSSIRGGARSAFLPAGVFLTGAVVAVLELACTGQVYFPTLAYMAQTDSGWLGLGSLLLYNLAFILPLLAVLALILLGIGQDRIRGFFERRIALAKGALAVIFAALAVLVWVY